jgi:hypothetical protein
MDVRIEASAGGATTGASSSRCAPARPGLAAPMVAGAELTWEWEMYGAGALESTAGFTFLLSSLKGRA